MLVAGVSVWYLVLAGVLASPAFALFAYVKWEKIVERIRGVLDPSAKYQVLQSLIALGSGGFWGKGLGMSTQKMGFLPEPFTDFIFSVIGEELGFVGCTLVIILFCLSIFFGLRIALNARDLSGFLLAFGATFSISLQALTNIAVVTGSAPTKGIPLPFISYGGSGLVLALTQVGLILNVALRSNCEVLKTEERQEGEGTLHEKEPLRGGIRLTEQGFGPVEAKIGARTVDLKEPKAQKEKQEKSKEEKQVKTEPQEDTSSGPQVDLHKEKVGKETESWEDKREKNSELVEPQSTEDKSFEEAQEGKQRAPRRLRIYSTKRKNRE